MQATIAVLPGDGIGPEVTAVAVECLAAVAKRFKHDFKFTNGVIGASAMDKGLDPLPAETLAIAQHADGILFGAIGHPKYADPTLKVRPELAILGIRQALKLYANLRPIVCYDAVMDASPLKPELLKGVDILMVRELTGGIYFGEKTRTVDKATDLCVYERYEIERIVHLGATLARSRRGQLTSVDKANVLETSRLWRQVVTEICAKEYPDISLNHMYVDAASMHLLRKPADFDVLITENMFGDILTDEASMLPGSLGLCASASIGATDGVGLYEPIHGSAPDIAGLGIANPYATILSAAWLLRLSLKLDTEAAYLEQAVIKTLEAGVRTKDLAPKAGQAATTQEAGQAVLSRI